MLFLKMHVHTSALSLLNLFLFGFYFCLIIYSICKHIKMINFECGLLFFGLFLLLLRYQELLMTTLTFKSLNRFIYFNKLLNWKKSRGSNFLRVFGINWLHMAVTFINLL